MEDIALTKYSFAKSLGLKSIETHFMISNKLVLTCLDCCLDVYFFFVPGYKYSYLKQIIYEVLIHSSMGPLQVLYCRPEMMNIDQIESAFEINTFIKVRILTSNVNRKYAIIFSLRRRLKLLIKKIVNFLVYLAVD